MYQRFDIHQSINITPNRSNIFINENNWPDVEQTIQNLFNLKIKNIQFTNISNIRIVDSIISKDIPTTWCDPNGCLEILGKAFFPINCLSSCQLYKINQIKTSNSIQPSIKLNLNSTLNMTYIIELDAFTVVILEDDDNGDEIKMFLMYNLMGIESRTLLSMSVPVDNSSLKNITRLVNDSIIQSQMNISEFIVVHADINMELSILNVTVLFRFKIKCMTNCQEIQVNKLKNTTSIYFKPIVIIYDGYAHFHNVSLTGVFDATSIIVPILTTMNTLIDSTDNTIQTTSSLIIDLAESIFEVFYKLQSYDLIFDGDLQLGRITDSSTINDLTDLMQTTISNYSDIAAIVFNATIDIDSGNSTIKASSSLDSINYILHLIVYYVYPITCNECVDISNNAIYIEPQISKLIKIRNATLIYIPSPSLVINLASYSRTTHLTSIDTISTSNQFSTDVYNTTSSTSIHTTTHLTTTTTTSQYHSTGHTSTDIHSTEHTSTNTHSTGHTSTDIHSTDHTSTNTHSTGHTSTDIHSTEHTSTNTHSTGHTSTDIHSMEHTSTNTHSTGHTSTDIHSMEHTSTNTHSTGHTSTDIHSTEHTGSSIHSTEHSSTDIHSTESISNNIHTTEHTSTNIQSTEHTGSNIHSTDHTSTYPHTSSHAEVTP